MYNIPYYKEKDPEVVMEFVRSHPFALLCACDANSKPVATQLPVFIDEKDGKVYLSGHIMRNTDHHLAIEQNPNVLVVFTGAQTHVSASWYTDKKQGSTWNYMTVHARGVATFLDRDALIDTLRRTTAHFENNPVSGANFEDLDQSYIDKMVKAIVAIRVEVTELDHVFKLSQNRDRESFENIRRKLDAKGGQAAIISAEMGKRQQKLFDQHDRPINQ